MKENIRFLTENEVPIYQGEFVVQHRVCPFVSIAKMFEVEFPMEIISKVSSGINVRFTLPQTVSMASIREIFREGFKRNIVKRVLVRIDGGSIFEVLTSDVAVKEPYQFRSLPFGDVFDYYVDSEEERFKVYSPSLEDLSGKERLFKLEKTLQKYGSAELLSFKRVDKYEVINRYLDRYRKLPEIFLKPDEIRIIEEAVRRGYFDVPKRVTLKELERQMGISATVLNEKLRSINRQILDAFLRRISEPL